MLILSSSEERQWEELFHQDKDIRELSWHAEGMILLPMFSLFLICFFVVIEVRGVAWLLKAFGDYQKLSGSSTRHGWVDRGTRDGDRLRRPTPGRKLRSGAGSKGLRMLTKQKAEPLLGMKLTLLRSGHKNGGISCRGLGLETQPRI